MSLVRYRRQGAPQQKIRPEYLERAAVVYLLPGLQRISAVQQAGRSSRRIVVLSGMPESAGGVSCYRSVGAAESGHTALNRSSTSSSLLLFRCQPRRTVEPSTLPMSCDDAQTFNFTLIVQEICPPVEQAAGA